MHVPVRVLPALLLALGAVPASAQVCSNTSVGFTPLDELGAGSYLGFQGGLYAGGASARPAAHEAAGLAQAALVVPRDATGAPDPAGKIVFISVGMSNANQEFGAFLPLANADPLKAPEVTVLNLAQGGIAAEDMDSPSDPYWSGVLGQIGLAGLAPEQVQVVWLKNANRMPTDPFPTHAQTLQGMLESIVRIVRDLFPNARLCYTTSRIYAGYATSALSPEPFAYESGFATKWMIERQVAGAADLNYDAALGPVEAPWLSWASYNWGDGLVPRADGLIWECVDFQPDGTHPSTSGRGKVAGRLLDFLHADSTATWYRVSAPPAGGMPFCDASDRALAVCPCGNTGAPDTGCDLPQATGGVRLDVLAQATGPNSATLSATGYSTMGAPAAIVLRSPALDASGPHVFGDGVRCVSTTSLVRLAASTVAAGQSTHVFGHGAGPGDFYYQVWARSQPASFCTNDAFNLSSGRILAW